MTGGHLVLAAGSTLLTLSEVHSRDPLQLLLVEFEDIFAEPSTLSPKRFFDHSILLKPNSKHVSIRSL